MVQTQRTSEISVCIDDFLLDARASRRAAGTLRFYRQKLTPSLVFMAALTRRALRADLCLQCRVKAGKLGQHLALPCWRIGGEGAVPIGKRIGLRARMIVGAEVNAEEIVDQSRAQFAHGDVCLAAQMDDLKRFEQPVTGTRLHTGLFRAVGPIVRTPALTYTRVVLRSEPAAIDTAPVPQHPVTTGRV